MANERGAKVWVKFANLRARTTSHQFEMALPDFISLNMELLCSYSKLWLPFQMHSWSNFAPGSNQFNLLITFHLHNRYNICCNGFNYPFIWLHLFFNFVLRSDQWDISWSLSYMIWIIIRIRRKGILCNSSLPSDWRLDDWKILF